MSLLRPLNLLLALLAVTLLLIAVTGSAWLLGFLDRESEKDASEESRMKVVLSGYADVERGVASLHPLQPGRVEKVMVRAGQGVKSGEPLLRLNDQEATQRVKQAQADLKAAQAQLKEARKGVLQHQVLLDRQAAAIKAVEHRLAAAQHTLDRAEHLREKQLFPKEQFRATEEQVQALKAMLTSQRQQMRGLKLADPSLRVTQAEAQVEAKKAQQVLAQKALQERTLKAPAYGRVLRINVREGDVLGSGSRQPAVLFAPDEPMFIRVDVEQEFADQVQVGDRAFIRDRVNPDQQWKGKVVSISDVYLRRQSFRSGHSPLSIEPRTLECRVALDAGQSPLRIGQRVRVLFKQSRH